MGGGSLPATVTGLGLSVSQGPMTANGNQAGQDVKAYLRMTHRLSDSKRATLGRPVASPVFHGPVGGALLHGLDQLPPELALRKLDRVRTS